MINTCSKCHQEKPATKEYFYPGLRCRFGLRPECKICFAEAVNARIVANPAEAKARRKAYYLKHQEKARAYSNAWSKANRYFVNVTRRKYRKRLFATSPSVVLEHLLRRRVTRACQQHGTKKAHKTETLIGCTREFLMQHIQSQFKPGMAWNNRGLWHIDHIGPCASFDLTDPAQQRECFHYTNLQPLWASDNIRKSDKWEPAETKKGSTNAH